MISDIHDFNSSNRILHLFYRLLHTFSGALVEYPSLEHFEGITSPIICMFCWNDLTKDTKSCIRSSPKFNVSNISTHLTNQHKGENLKLKDAGGVSEKEKTSIISDSSAIIINPSTSTAAAINEKCNTLLYKFFNSANIAIRQSENPFLNDFLKYVTQHIPAFKGKKIDTNFSRHLYKKHEWLQFNQFILFVKHLVDRTRKWYLSECNQEVPFLTVSHDGWDSKDHDILGVSIHFVVPGDWIRINLAVGLKRVDSKKSEDTVQEINRMLQRYVFYVLIELLI